MKRFNHEQNKKFGFKVILMCGTSLAPKVAEGQITSKVTRRMET